MPNVTLSVPEDLYRRMRKYAYVKWTEVARRAFAQHVESIEQQTEGKVKVSELREMLEAKGLDVRKIPLKKAIRQYEEIRELEWKRAKQIYSTQTS